MTEIDLIVTNARIVTMNPAQPLAEALAIAGGRIMALGSGGDVRALAGRRTAIIDAGGRLVLPGFQDTHIHLQDSGQDYSQNADLSAAETPENLVATLRGFATGHARPWVLGTGWNSASFGHWNLDRHLLDRAVSDRPCLIVASDGHNGCLNSAGLAAVGFDRTTADPLNGTIVRTADGTATGLLYENAVMMAEARMPVPDDSAFTAGVLWAQRLAHRHGLTGVLDARVEARHVRVYRALAEAGRLSLRVAATALVTATDTPEAAVERLRAFRAAGTGRFCVHSAKFFLDGVIENRTAAMIEPYCDAQGGNGPLMFPPDLIARLFTALDADRFQIHVHAIGDLASRAALDGIAAARAANGPWPAHHQIAHVQFLDPADIPRFNALGVMANIQPLWARHEAPIDEMAIPLIGPERARWIYAFQSLAKAGADLALSSDWGVSTLNPFAIIETAVTRQPAAGEPSAPPLLPHERLTRWQAVAGYTLGAAQAAWRADETGSLSPGKFADLIMLDRDIFACPATEISGTRVLLTLVSGQPVHQEPA
jgi:predicted amidohydrolase YtcJ